MCGIVGYIGMKNATAILLDGLRRLEYRGYDSSGLVLNTQDQELWIRKTIGRVADLDRIVNDPPNAHIGIAHTRWATHGGVSDQNAHPHMSFDQKVVIVHNGIIDNAQRIRTQLEAEGVVFQSETDTESLTHLIAHIYKSIQDPYQAVELALQQIEGTYGLAVMFVDHPNLLIAARLGSPLVIGVGDDESILASDPQAIVGHTRRVIYLNDHEIALIRGQSVDLRRLDGRQAELQVELLEEHYEVAQKGDFEHFMLKEIYEQPDSVEHCMAGRVREATGGAYLGGMNMNPRDLVSLHTVIPIGCGTAYYAGLTTSMIIEYLARLPSHAQLATDFRSRRTVLPQNALFLAFSQSGETADTMGAVQEILTKGGDVSGVVNVVGSSLARLCGKGVYLHAGPEVAVASTKAFTAQITAGIIFSLMLARARLLSDIEGTELIRKFAKVPMAMRRYLANPGPVQQAAEFMVAASYVLFMGRGFSYPVALEGALKFKEIAYVPCEGYHAGEMKHGPIAMLQEGTPVVVIAPKDSQNERTMANMKEAQARGASLIVIHTEGDKAMEDIATFSIPIPKVVEFASPLVSVIPVQLLAYYAALKIGADIDKPRNLAKSVTVE
jgi:glutamine---fructose-6-phosphate transaminase (isomerizing)